MNPFLRFLHVWAGVDSDVLATCPQNERRKYSSIGGLVLLTATFAYMASSYAFFTVFESRGLASLLGALWAMVILNLDRLLLTTFPKTLGGLRQFGHAMLRISLAAFIGITIAHPLTVRIFQQEITDKLVAEALATQKRLETERDGARQRLQQDMLTMKAALPEFGEVEQRKEERNSLVTQLSTCESQMVLDKQKYLCEADGTCGTGIKTCGPVCEEKKAAYRITEAQCRSLRRDVTLAIASLTQAEQKLVPATRSIDTQIQSRDARIDQEFNRATVGQQAIKNSSFFARSEAMARLDVSARTKAWFVTLSLILIETMVVLIKVMTPPDGADKLVVAIHAVFVADHIPTLAKVFADTGTPSRPSSVNAATMESTTAPGKPSAGSLTLGKTGWFQNTLFVLLTMLVMIGMFGLGCNLGDALSAAALFVSMIAYTFVPKNREAAV